MTRPNVGILGTVPGAIGRIAELHATYYSREWRFGLYFEAKVATELSRFLSGFKEGRDGFWTAVTEDRVQGGVAIDGTHASSEGAHLRWYIVSPKLQGQGVGRSLLNRALQFCRDMQYPRVYLWTFEGLDTARHLYEQNGFRLVFQQEGDQWGTQVNEQKFVLEI